MSSHPVTPPSLSVILSVCKTDGECWRRPPSGKLLELVQINSHALNSVTDSWVYATHQGDLNVLWINPHPDLSKIDDGATRSSWDLSRRSVGKQKKKNNNKKLFLPYFCRKTRKNTCTTQKHLDILVLLQKNATLKTSTHNINQY